MSLQDTFNQNDSHVELPPYIPELGKLEKDKAYSKHEESKLFEAEESKDSENDQK